LLRREGLYSSHLTLWRRQRAAGRLGPGGGRKQSAVERELRRELAREKRENECLRQRLERAETIIVVQKTLCAASRFAAGRALMLAAVKELAVAVDTRTACDAAGVSRATYDRQDRLRSHMTRVCPEPAWALTPAEREQILAVLHSERFMDAASAEIVATLLAEGT